MTILGVENHNVVPYAILAAAACYIWWVEHKDIHCPTFDSSKEECDKYGGMSFSYTRPEKSDSCATLVSKISKAAGAEQASVKWRRAFIFSVAIMATMWILVGYSKTNQGLPDWRILYLSVAIGFVILIGIYLYYSFHVWKNPEDWIRESLKMLEEKECLKV